MTDKMFFLKNGFHVVDSAPSDFELLIKKFDANAPDPAFRKDTDKKLKEYDKGLTIIRADQCPYTVKNVGEICEAAEKTFKIKPRIINLKSHVEAQKTPCPFGTFCIIYEGKVIAEHPISSTRFKNIMSKVL